MMGCCSWIFLNPLMESQARSRWRPGVPELSRERPAKPGERAGSCIRHGPSNDPILEQLVEKILEAIGETDEKRG